MDPDKKTLDQLSQGGKEKNYVTLETASKLSGYTKDYLERLCRFDHIEHGTLAEGQFVLELESLLRETHTILLNYEGIVFIDKKKILEGKAEVLAPQVPPLQKIPAAVTAPIQSTVQPPSPVEATTALPPRRIPQKPAPAPVPFAPILSPQVQSIPPPPPAPTVKPQQQAAPLPPLEQKLTPASPVPQPAPSLQPQLTPVSSPPALPQTKPITVPPPPPPILPPEPKVILTPTPSAPPTPPAPVYSDEWDELLFSGVNNTPEEPSKESPATPPSVAPLYDTPSPYRPIATSVDPTPHRDDAPLFSFSLKQATEKVSVLAQTSPTTLPSPAQNTSSVFAVTVGIGRQSAAESARGQAGQQQTPSAALPAVGEERHLAVPEQHSLMQKK